ncbi:MAG: hypothetical protein ABEJ56_05565 [Candidatus Nanohaloarchaea archaeon]
MGMSTNQSIALAAVVGLAVALGAGVISVPQLSAPSGQQSPNDGTNKIEAGKSSTLSVAAFDQTQDSSTQVAPSIYSWKTSDGTTVYLGSKSGSASSRTDFTNYNTGEDYKTVAFSDTYEWGQAITGMIDSENVLKNLNVYEEAASADISITLFDENGDSTTSVNLGSDEQYAFNGIETEVSASNVAANPEVVAVDVADKTNVSNVEMPNAKSIAVPDAFADSYDYAFRVYDAGKGKPLLGGYESVKSGKLVVTADSDGTNGESATIKIAQSAPFINQNDRLAHGIQDDSDTPAFTASTFTKSVTFN